MQDRFSLCPGDDDLAGFLARAIEPAACGAIEAHLDRCGRCREVIGHLAAIRDGAGAGTGSGWIE
jgi:hypothetical protein